MEGGSSSSGAGQCISEDAAAVRDSSPPKQTRGRPRRADAVRVPEPQFSPVGTRSRRAQKKEVAEDLDPETKASRPTRAVQKEVAEVVTTGTNTSRPRRAKDVAGDLAAKAETTRPRRAFKKDVAEDLVPEAETTRPRRALNKDVGEDLVAKAETTRPRRALKKDVAEDHVADAETTRPRRVLNKDVAEDLGADAESTRPRRAPKKEGLGDLESETKTSGPQRVPKDENEISEDTDSKAKTSRPRRAPKKVVWTDLESETKSTESHRVSKEEVPEDLESKVKTSNPRRALKNQSAEVLETEAEPQTSKPRGRRPAAHAVDPVVAASRSLEGEVTEHPTGWSDLPAKLLMTTLNMLGNEDVVSAGQSCRRWRAVAKQHSVWSRRQLSYDLPPAADKKFQDWHGGAKAFARTIRFAPCLGRVSCAKTLKAGARKAIATQSNCQVKSAELNGQLQWTEKYISRQTSLVDLTLLNPTAQALQTALAQPQLGSLAVSYERDTTKEKYQQKYAHGFGSAAKYQVPAVPSGTKGSLKKLVCHAGVRHAAVQALVLANAATLEEVGAHCLPMAALQKCAALRRLMVKLNPASASDQDKIRQLARGAALEYVAFIGTRSHAKPSCAALRASLRKQVRGCTVVCSACEDVCALEKPTFASREVPDLKDDDDGDLDLHFVANLLRGSGHCKCICCAQGEAEWGDDEPDA
ncbi:uncharacterized protein LOC117642404 [Thrips palmi]|uniref:Uncharacterized protein LOC117642404 n=1 Tax=Thrips palmi TaxID=161013 RepID=A0A6P8YQZ6_THRPL|nr:uncharacterized protein LOC117642404 [Thrips palmi]XP_034236463.1 uncharacterized protein LOC117642404 [Thrips palmi]XP_034236464.1 uncharacterized protein LOC117642404 [Thrips palmi]XP_034236465.1 uncharacterized protein LOC117642404 [Thrips palmi]XP_034236466.1 uncharacterized protein LOC117642404 [Thrips palmi]XP_034236468.1 uncharacterized protein LOC117642404 [Thrips palmi]XP_034236469.1 uncharacterized protein LOC117642404 [Thrips palmi]XP_034236470.1 uncharacterized protein LOC1176